MECVFLAALPALSVTAMVVGLYRRLRFVVRSNLQE
jgi:hypothetical protein